MVNGQARAVINGIDAPADGTLSDRRHKRYGISESKFVQLANLCAILHRGRTDVVPLTDVAKVSRNPLRLRAVGSPKATAVHLASSRYSGEQMKSRTSQLRGRGFLSIEDVAVFGHLSTTNLAQQLESDDAVERSAAIRLLAQRTQPDVSMNRLFADRLKRETKLYTKIELCEALQTGGEETARILIPLLGMIGSNQHKQPSPEAFKKSSYPLPRDIVARILARMDPAILPAMTSAIPDGPRAQVVEAIDAVGFMCFYSSVTEAHRLLALRALIKRLHGSPNDELTRWKIVLAFESFNHPDSLSILRENIEDCAVPAIRQEARRSLTLAAKQPAM